MKSLLTAFLAAASLATALSAATRSVPSQYSTIQAAVNAAASGDTINIANGTYNEQVTIPSGKNSLKIVGASQTGVIITAGLNQKAVVVNANDTTFSYLTIRNTGTTPVNGWTLSFAFPDGQTITNMWGGTPTQTDGTVSVASAPWTSTIPAAGSVSLGFTGTKGTTNGTPSTFTLNGATCTTA